MGVMVGLRFCTVLLAVLAVHILATPALAQEAKPCNQAESTPVFMEFTAAYRAGNFDEAKAHLVRAVDLVPSTLSCASVRGTYFQALGALEVTRENLPNAIVAYRESLRLEGGRLDTLARQRGDDPGSLRSNLYDRTSFLLADALVRSSQWSDAARLIDAYFNSNPRGFSAENIGFQELHLQILNAMRRSDADIEEALRKMIRYRSALMKELEKPPSAVGTPDDQRNTAKFAENHDALADLLARGGRNEEAHRERQRAAEIRARKR